MGHGSLVYIAKSHMRGPAYTLLLVKWFKGKVNRSWADKYVHANIAEELATCSKVHQKIADSVLLKDVLLKGVLYLEGPS